MPDLTAIVNKLKQMDAGDWRLWHKIPEIMPFEAVSAGGDAIVVTRRDLTETVAAEKEYGLAIGGSVLGRYHAKTQGAWGNSEIMDLFEYLVQLLGGEQALEARTRQAAADERARHRQEEQDRIDDILRRL